MSFIENTSKLQLQAVRDDCFDRLRELEAFDNTKAGVKGLADAGVVSIPKIFVRPLDERSQEDSSACLRKKVQVPIIDLGGIDSCVKIRKQVVDQIKLASMTWGFFQVLNHGIPVQVMDQMIDGVRKFHEQDLELKKDYYSHDHMKTVRYDSSIDLYRSRFAKWRDTLNISLLVPGKFQPEHLPSICRHVTMNYMNEATKLGGTLFDLLSEALGLKTDHLRSLECASGRKFVGHYYPGCPEPELTLGANKHTDPSFLTILLQDSIGGLQFLHDNQWTDVLPLAGSLVVNIGDLLQIVSNDKFKSVEHRVLANHAGPRISVATFFTGVVVPEKVYGPIKELIPEGNPAIFKEFIVRDYIKRFYSRSGDMSGVDSYKQS
ncbi:1-aminocyclopropane-1-carboxylate oxidase-like [Heracleum sosnowskyi]|uniref:1-aminocyclopropane-1-carboxylate oxidase-like n=1 Tax=Heracleum sosnowskyi TaxID=360622 RepID=A0AAD8N5C2_9APIA|nr:1-aminocyclopropane-1-carboxylate oxidase-like [Heracleum sosnowskyi]